MLPAEPDAMSQSNLGQMQGHSGSLVHLLCISTVHVWQVSAVELMISSDKIFLVVTNSWCWTPVEVTNTYLKVVPE
jgi:hypothetical protein